MLQKPEPTLLPDNLDSRAQSFAPDIDEIDEQMGHLTLSLGEDEESMDSSNNALSQLEELASGLESVRETLADCRGGADSMTLRLAKHAHQSFAQRAKLDINDYSVESIGGSISRDAATKLALESITDTIKKAYQRFVAFLTRLWDAFMNFMGRIFEFFRSTSKRLARLKAKALQLKAANAQSSVEELKLPSRLHYAFQVKNRHIDPVALVKDGEYIDRIEKFSEAYVKYTRTVLAEMSEYLKNTPSWRAGELPAKLRALLNPEQLVLSSFKGDTERTTGRISSHMDIPGNKVVTVSALLGYRVATDRDLYKLLNSLKVVVRPYDVPGKPQETIPQLTLDHVVEICDQAIRALAAVDRHQSEVRQLNGERSKILRSAAILIESDRGNVDLNPSLKNNILIAISRYVRGTLATSAAWMNLQRKIIMNVGDVAFIATRQYGKLEGEQSSDNTNPFTVTVQSQLKLT